jgi:hypothetical protein
LCPVYATCSRIFFSMYAACPHYIYVCHMPIYLLSHLCCKPTCLPHHHFFHSFISIILSVCLSELFTDVVSSAEVV